MNDHSHRFDTDELDDVLAQNSPVCLMGLGYVGLPLALRLVEAGFEVWGIERQDAVCADLRVGKSHVYEPGLPEHLVSALASGRFHLSGTIPATVPFRSFIISVGTPLEPDGSVNFNGIESTTRQIVEVVKPGALVMLRSTVAVGTTREVVRPILDAVPGVELAFCPERTLQGRAFEELRSLPQVVAGETPHACVRAANFFHQITRAVVKVSSLEAAEIVKLTTNTFRDITFGFANEAARLCDVVGVSATEVVQAAGLGYPRGTMPRPGPVGGSCLTKDPAILVSTFHSYGLDTPLVTSSARQSNEQVVGDAAYRITEALVELGLRSDPTAAVLGIAFKGWPETGDIRGSQSVALIEQLRQAHPNLDVRSHDRISTPNDHQSMGYQQCQTPQEAVKGANILVIGNDHPSYLGLDLVGLTALMTAPAVVYDLWGLFKAQARRLPAHVRYYAPGEVGGAPRARTLRMHDLPGRDTQPTRVQEVQAENQVAVVGTAADATADATFAA